jgi:diadenosine tetraphosphatase ApaH/serine/threonine PP2A family protein phosphatase
VLFDLSGPATKQMIGPSRIEWLRALATDLRHENLALMHASPGNLWRAPMDTADDTELEQTYTQLNARTVVYCHIHRPFIRKVGSMTVCNTGSVGAPYDGDPRASYLLIDDGKPAIRRVAYDVEKEASRLLASNYPLKSGPRRCASKEVTCRPRRVAT